jgi:hypothetical protein
MPTRADTVETVWNLNSTPRTASLTGTGVGDLIVCLCAAEDANGALGTPSTTVGTTSAWTLRVNVGLAGSSCRAAIWTATVSTAGTVTVSQTINPSGVVFWGMKLVRYAAADWTAIGATGSKFPVSTTTDEFDSSAGTNYTLSSLVTTVAGSMIEFIDGDWSANSTNPTAGERQETDAGTMTVYTASFPGNTVNYGVHTGQYADAGATGTKIIGFTPIRKPSLAAVEITAPAGAPAGPPPNSLKRWRY